MRGSVEQFFPIAYGANRTFRILWLYDGTSHDNLIAQFWKFIFFVKIKGENVHCALLWWRQPTAGNGKVSSVWKYKLQCVYFATLFQLLVWVGAATRHTSTKVQDSRAFNTWTQQRTFSWLIVEEKQISMLLLLPRASEPSTFRLFLNFQLTIHECWSVGVLLMSFGERLGLWRDGKLSKFPFCCSLECWGKILMK